MVNDIVTAGSSDKIQDTTLDKMGKSKSESQKVSKSVMSFSLVKDDSGALNLVKDEKGVLKVVKDEKGKLKLVKDKGGVHTPLDDELKTLEKDILEQTISGLVPDDDSNVSKGVISMDTGNPIDLALRNPSRRVNKNPDNFVSQEPINLASQENPVNLALGKAFTETKEDPTRNSIPEDHTSHGHASVLDQPTTITQNVITIDSNDDEWDNSAQNYVAGLVNKGYPIVKGDPTSQVQDEKISGLSECPMIVQGDSDGQLRTSSTFSIQGTSTTGPTLPEVCEKPNIPIIDPIDQHEPLRTCSERCGSPKSSGQSEKVGHIERSCSQQ